MNLNEWRRSAFNVDPDTLLARGKTLLPGAALCFISVLAAVYITEHYGGPVILIALLIGMAFNNLTEVQAYQSGLNFCANDVLKFGVALLGAQLTFSDVSRLGHAPFTLSILAIAFTFFSSFALGHLLKLDRISCLISAAAVGICGVSAALAVAAALPMKSRHQQHLLCTLACLAGASTLAMIVYPALGQNLLSDPLLIGLFLGASIHDVAQVAGAGYLISDQAGDMAVYTKMIRVAALLPVVILIGIGFNCRQQRMQLPAFLIAFFALAVMTNAGVISAGLQDVLSDLSKACLLVAMVALGARISLPHLLASGWKPALMVAGNTVALAAMALLFCFLLE